MYSFINGYFSLIVFNLPGGTIGVSVTIMSLRIALKMDDVLAGNIVLLVRDDGVLILVSR